MERFVTVFRGARDFYQVPLALYEQDLLAYHVAEWYSPLDQKLFQNALAALPRLQKLLNKRYYSGLPSTKASLAPSALLKDVFNLAGGSHLKVSEESVDRSLGKWAGYLARKHKAGLLSYNYYAYPAFRALGISSQPRLLFQCHPHPKTVKEILSRELQLNPDCHASLLAEEELKVSSTSRFEQLSREAAMADGCIVTSSFTRQSLIENGVAAAQISCVPYGVDLQSFRPGPRPDDDKFRVLFVGSLIQRKGLKYLLEAWKSLSLKKAELILVGRGSVDNFLLAKYEGHFTLLPNLSLAKLIEIYQKADVFCLPSLIEGFGLVILEALACGTPVIATSHTAAADIVEPNRNGFVLEPGKIEQLAEQLNWCYRERTGKLAQMRPFCRSRAEEYPWANFRSGLTEQLTRFIS